MAQVVASIEAQDGQTVSRRAQSGIYRQLEVLLGGQLLLHGLCLDERFAHVAEHCAQRPRAAGRVRKWQGSVPRRQPSPPELAPSSQSPVGFSAGYMLPMWLISVPERP